MKNKIILKNKVFPVCNNRNVNQNHGGPFQFRKTAPELLQRAWKSFQSSSTNLERTWNRFQFEFHLETKSEVFYSSSSNLKVPS